MRGIRKAAGRPGTRRGLKLGRSAHLGKAQGIGHASVCWFVSEQHKVCQAFEHIWGTLDLIASFDGANALRPWQRLRPQL